VLVDCLPTRCFQPRDAHVAISFIRARTHPWRVRVHGVMRSHESWSRMTREQRLSDSRGRRIRHCSIIAKARTSYEKPHPRVSLASILGWRYNRESMLRPEVGVDEKRDQWTRSADPRLCFRERGRAMRRLLAGSVQLLQTPN